MELFAKSIGLRSIGSHTIGLHLIGLRDARVAFNIPHRLVGMRLGNDTSTGTRAVRHGSSNHSVLNRLRFDCVDEACDGDWLLRRYCAFGQDDHHGRNRSRPFGIIDDRYIRWNSRPEFSTGRSRFLLASATTRTRDRELQSEIYVSRILTRGMMGCGRVVGGSVF
jgi:hypothetical protein